MKVSLINGSPKAKDSSSGMILEELETLLSPFHDIVNLHVRKKQLSGEELKLMENSEVMVLAFPLYVDALPSHLLSCLMQLEQHLKNSGIHRKHRVYAIVNCGFYEGEQNIHALEIIENWCARTGIVYGGGLGVGAGGMMSIISKTAAGKGPKKNFSQALNVLADRISNGEKGENICFSPNFPRFLYKAAGEMGWRQTAKSNGLKTRDLWKQEV